MKPLVFLFEPIDRSAFVIKPRKPLHDWLIKIEADSIHDNFDDDPNVYLIPSFNEPYEIEPWIEKNYDLIFCDQMNLWCLDESKWIQNRTFKLFKEWFDFSFHTIIFDTLEKPIGKQ
jgi:hypothetical protein